MPYQLPEMQYTWRVLHSMESDCNLTENILRQIRDVVVVVTAVEHWGASLHGTHLKNSESLHH